MLVNDMLFGSIGVREVIFFVCAILFIFLVMGFMFLVTNNILRVLYIFLFGFIVLFLKVFEV